MPKKKSDLKSRSQIVDDVLLSFEDSYRQVKEFQDKGEALVLLYHSFKGILQRCSKTLAAAEGASIK